MFRRSILISFVSGVLITMIVGWAPIFLLPTTVWQSRSKPYFGGIDTYTRELLQSVESDDVVEAGTVRGRRGEVLALEFHSMKVEAFLSQRRQAIPAIDGAESTTVAAPFTRAYIAQRVQSGWPFTALRGGLVNRVTSAAPSIFGGIRIFSVADRPAVLPLVPCWPGLVINVLAYAAAVWTLLRGAKLLQALRRRRRGRCPACAYPVGSSTNCTECGAALTKRTARRPSRPSTVTHL